MWSKVKKFFRWIKAHAEWILLAIVTIFIVIICVVWHKKTKLIESLQNDLAILKAKLNIEKIAVKNELLIQDLKDVRKKDAEVQKELDAIEKDLEIRLSNNMSTEEISEAFNKLPKIK